MALLSPASLARLERLVLLSRRSFSAGTMGERRSTVKGSSAEFADHRPYQLGDDPRYLDWNAFARLERLFIKLFNQEVELSVNLVVDASASMSFGEPSKLLLAKRLAAGLAYIALSNFDRAGLLWMHGKAEGGILPGRGSGWMVRILKALDGLEAEGRPDPAVVLSKYAALQKRRGLTVIFSDFLDPRYPQALMPLLSRRHEVWCVQILCPEDWGDGLSGDLEIVDSETQERREITFSAPVLSAYRRGVEQFKTDLERWCLDRGVGFASVGSEADFEDIIASLLRRRRLVG